MACEGRKRIFSKVFWKDAIGAAKKSKRLKLIPNDDRLFYCPISTCETNGYKSQRGCRKHVYTRHGWFYYFDEKPSMEVAFPGMRLNKSSYTLSKRSQTSNIPMFSKDCQAAKNMTYWLRSAGGGGKNIKQANEIVTRILKFAKYCCQDIDTDNVSYETLEYCLNSVKHIEDFINYLKVNWNCGNAGIIAYLNSFTHFLDYERSKGVESHKLSLLISAEVYMQRSKRTFGKEMRLEWNKTLSIEYFEKNNCWASFNELQSVIPFHKKRFDQILCDIRNGSFALCHDLSFCTSFIVCVLFLKVKASRPMTYQCITTDMVDKANFNEIIDQTEFKTNKKYSFDSLIIDKEVLTILTDYIQFVRPLLNPKDNVLLICRNGNPLVRLGDVFGRLVYQVLGKYIHPTRYRQIIETESMEKLTVEEQQSISEDQKHTSQVAKVHYQKLHSRDVAKKSRACLEKLKMATSDQQVDMSIQPSTSVACTNVSGTSSLTETQNVNNSKQRRKKVPFSDLEDEFIVKGIRKYGSNKWTNILNDVNYKFHLSRKPSTLCNRAKAKNFI